MEPNADHVRWLTDSIPALRLRALELTSNDHAGADDLVQNTLARWWERPPERVTSTTLKRWLRTVMYHAAVDSVRRRTDEDMTLPGAREVQFVMVELLD